MSHKIKPSKRPIVIESTVVESIMSAAVAAPTSVPLGGTVKSHRTPGTRTKKSARNANFSKEMQALLVQEAVKKALNKQKKEEAMKAAGVVAKKKKNKNRRDRDVMMTESKLATAVSNKKAKKSKAASPPVAKDAKAAAAPASKKTGKKKS